MEVSRYLRKDKINKRGFVPIRLRVYLYNQDVPITTGEYCKPEQWLEDEKKVDGRKNTYAHIINSNLSRYEATIYDIFHEWKKRDDLLTPAILKEELKARLEKKAEEPTPEPEPDQEDTHNSELFRMMYKWRDAVAKRRQKGTGRKTSPNTIKNINSSIARFREFETYRKKLLTYASFDREFYNEFETYVLDKLKQEINTFGRHISKLKAFLRWCEEEHEIAVNLRYRKYEVPSVYVGVDALTERELMAIARIDFKSPEVRKKVVVDDSILDARLQDLEISRDMLLLMCYTGLRISDAIKLDLSYIKGDMIVIPATKTLNTCYIPLFDDSLFKPNEIITKYEGLYDTCMPPCPKINEHLKTIQKLANIKRFILSTKLGRKTFVTLKLYQGVPSRMVMQATGHKTEAAFNRYAGTDTKELGEIFKHHSAKSEARKKLSRGTEWGTE